MVILATSARNAACDAIVDLFDGGDIILTTSAPATLATLDFGTPAFGASATGVATANAIADHLSAVAGTIDHAHMRTSGAVETIELTVTTTAVGTGDILISNTTLGTGDTVSMSSMTATMPAS